MNERTHAQCYHAQYAHTHALWREYLKYVSIFGGSLSKIVIMSIDELSGNSNTFSQPPFSDQCHIIIDLETNPRSWSFIYDYSSLKTERTAFTFSRNLESVRSENRLNVAID